MIEFWECDHCGARFKHDPHRAVRKHYAYDGFIEPETRALCCACYESVGGKCDGHGN